MNYSYIYYKTNFYYTKIYLKVTKKFQVIKNFLKKN